MNGARFYNLLAGLFTAYFAWKICKQLGVRHHWLAPIFVLFIPLYFVSMFTSLTGVTFSLFLVLSLFFFFRNKFVWSGLILSFIILVRSEGIIVLLPLFMAAFLLRKRYAAFFSLFTGFIIFSIVGLLVYHDFWWLITRNPYDGSASNIYGHGILLHFVYKLPKILGYPLTFLFLIGFVVLIFQWLRYGKGKFNDTFYFLLLVPGSFLIYFAAHSYAWWKGIGNSLGLIRVIAAVTPTAAITALIGFDKILIYLKKNSQIFKAVIALGAMIWIMLIGARTYRNSFNISAPQRLMNKAVIFVKSHNLENNPIYYFSSYFVYKMEVDPYSGKMTKWYPKGSQSIEKLPAGSVIVWDAHFGPNEGHMPLVKLLKNSNIKLLKKIKPPHPFKVLGGYNYAIYIFQKLP